MTSDKKKGMNSAGQKPATGSKQPREASENIRAAHDQAEKDIDKDPDLSIHSPNDDLDEGETARLGGDKTDLV